MKDTPQSLLEDVKNNLPLLYDVEEDYKVSLLKYSENIIYKVEFSKSSPVVFRIHRPGYHDIEELEGEIRWMDEIHKDTQVRLPVVYRGRDGGFLQKNADIRRGNCILLCYLIFRFKSTWRA